MHYNRFPRRRCRFKTSCRFSSAGGQIRSESERWMCVWLPHRIEWTVTQPSKPKILQGLPCSHWTWDVHTHTCKNHTNTHTHTHTHADADMLLSARSPQSSRAAWQTLGGVCYVGRVECLFPSTGGLDCSALSLTHTHAHTHGHTHDLK